MAWGWNSVTDEAVDEAMDEYRDGYEREYEFTDDLSAPTEDERGRPLKQ